MSGSPVDDELPENLAELAALHKAGDQAWVQFLETPAWAVLKRVFERQLQSNIKQAGQFGLSDGDRAVLAGMNFVLSTFLSSPGRALQRLRMQATTPTREGDQ